MLSDRSIPIRNELVITTKKRDSTGIKTKFFLTNFYIGNMVIGAVLMVKHDVFIEHDPKRRSFLFPHFLNYLLDKTT